MHWTIDDLSDDVARLETEEGDALTLPRRLLPSGARVGDVLRVRQERTTGRALLELERDVEATRAARAASRAQVADLTSAPDPGGDITL